MRRVHVATHWILLGPTFCAVLVEESALHRMILCAMRFTTSFVSRASTRVGSPLASFLHRLSRGRGGRVDIMILNAAVGHTLVDIVVVDPIRRDLVERAVDMISSLPQMRSERRKLTVRIAQLGRNLCPLLLRRTVHCLICQIDFWSSVPR